MMKRWIEFIVRHPKTVISVVGLISLFFFYQTTGLHFEIDFKRNFPQNHPFVILNNKIQDTFDSSKLVLVGVLPNRGDIYQPSTLKKIDVLTRKLALIPGVNNVFSITDPKVSYVHATEDTLNVEPLIQKIPSSRDGVSFARLKKRISESIPYRGILVSNDGKAAAGILVDFKENVKDTLIHQAIRTVVEEETYPDHRLLIAGAPIGMDYMDRYSKRMNYIFPIALLIITALHFWTFRSWQSVFLPFATGLMSVGWSLGLMSMLHIPMDTFNTGTPVLVLAIAGGHSVQILKRYYDELYLLRDNRLATIEATSRIGVVMITAGLIAALALASLGLTFRLQTIRSFGLLCSFGIVSALILEMTFIPACRSLLTTSENDFRTAERKDILDGFVDGIRRLSRAGRTRTVIVLLLIAGVVVAGLFRVRVADNWKDYFPSSVRLLQDDRILNTLFFGSSTFYILIEGDAPGDIQEPAVLKGMNELEEFVRRQPGVGGVSSITDYLKWMNQAMHGGNRSFSRVPDSRQMAAQFLFTYSLSSGQGILDRYIDYEYRKALIRVFLKSDDVEIASRLVDQVNAFAKGRFPSTIAVRLAGGSAGNVLAMNKVLVHGKLLNIMQMGLVVFLVASLVFRSFIGGFIISVPLYITILANFAVMGWTGITLSLSTSHISAMVMGLGADYSIYLVYRYREEWNKYRDPERALTATMNSSGKAILFIATAIAAGYFPFVLSGFRPFIHFGILVICAMLVSSLSTLYIMPYIINRFKPLFIFGSQEAFTESPVLRKFVKQEQATRYPNELE